MEIKGTISNLTTQGTVSNFVLRGADGSETRIQSSRPLPPGVKNGSLVVVNGNNPPDPPFLADSVEKLDAPKTPWLLIGAIAVVLLILIGLGIYFLIPRAQSTWTIQATDSGAAASNVPIQLLDSNKQPLKTATTDANGDAAFPNLAAGTYYASGPGVSAPVSATFSKTASQQTSSLAVKSPFTWTVNTLLCGRPDANNQLQLESPAKEIVKIGVTDATGKFVFTNLETGASTVFGPNNLSGSATLNGTAPPSPITLTIPPPPIGCLIFPHFPHPLMYADRPPALKEHLQKPQ
ncbi:MAG TPA: SpaA isopeptide-forming pilin-related protein [Bryocella sp.]|nr:SpaA isopeptide-forming pilin-related protein [Bryocella sp.]